MGSPAAPDVLNLKNEFVQTLNDLSQYLKFQNRLGNREISLSLEAKTTMDKWGTPGWRSHGFASQGPESAALMLVDSEGTFFNGPAGELLTKILKAMRLTPSQVFICNAVDLSSIRNHIGIHRPKCMLCLGEKAGRLLLNRQDKIRDFRGQFLSFENIHVMVTHHPGALIRQPDLKREVWDDVQQVMARAGL